MLRLHGYWRSTASYRVRIALNLKGLPFAQATHDLRVAEQRAPEYLDLAPQGLVPALDSDAGVITQSLAILEWLEEQWPTPALLPRDPYDRAIVRSMALLVAADVHPLNNLRVLTWLRGEGQLDEDKIAVWMARWIGDGFAALEQLIVRHGGRYAFGDTPSFADCAIVPQVYGARRFGIDLEPFPRLLSASAAAEALPAVQAAHPARQPDADPQP
jgi:maleylpyruvate isomerase